MENMINEKERTNRDFLVDTYLKFIKKLTGDLGAYSLIVNRIDAAFAGDFDRDIDIMVELVIKDKNGVIKTRPKRSIYQFVNFRTNKLPKDTVKVTFNAEFVEYINNVQVKAVKKKDRFAFKEEIVVVPKYKESLIRKITRKKMEELNEDVMIFTHEDLKDNSGILKM